MEPNVCSVVSELTFPGTGERRRAELITSLDPASLSPYGFSEIYFYAYSPEWPYACWDDDGYFPERSNWKSEIQLLWASREAYMQISNGGITQFFYNDGGERAPEVAEWLRMLGDDVSAQVIDEGRELMGTDFRSRNSRTIRLKEPAVWDRLQSIYDSLGKTMLQEDDFDEASDRFLMQNCGIRKLTQLPHA